MLLMQVIKVKVQLLQISENIDKETGGFTFLVYGRDTDDFGHTVIHETTPDGRMTHWVQELQG